MEPVLQDSVTAAFSILYNLLTGDVHVIWG